MQQIEILQIAGEMLAPRRIAILVHLPLWSSSHPFKLGADVGVTSGKGDFVESAEWIPQASTS